MVWVRYQEYHNLVPCVCPPRRTKGTSDLSPSQRLPLGIPIRIAVIEKIESARGTMGWRTTAPKTWIVKNPWNRIEPLLYYYLHNSVQKHPIVGWFSQNHRKRTAHHMAEASLPSSPFPSCPESCLFLSSQLPHNTEASGEKREITLNGATWRPEAPETQKQLLLDLFFRSNSYPFMIYFSKWLIWLKTFRQ